MIHHKSLVLLVVYSFYLIDVGLLLAFILNMAMRTLLLLDEYSFYLIDVDLLLAFILKINHKLGFII